jgi:ArsR family transcriptional regulator
LTSIDSARIFSPEMLKELPKLAGRVAASVCCPGGAKVRPKATAQYARLFKALGDETRLEMLGLLAAAGAELCVCDIERQFDLAQPTVSHHLKVLREAGLVTSERRGTWVYYALDRGALGRLKEFQAMLGG